MNPYGDSTFRRLYLNSLKRALSGLRNTNGSYSHDQKDEVPDSSSNIKLAADVSLAMTANHPAWSRALMNRISGDQNNRPSLRRMLGPKTFQAIMVESAKYKSRLILQSKLKRAHMNQHKTFDGFRRYNMLLCRNFYSKGIDPVRSSSYARSVRRRTKQLQRLVPGGKSMETSSLLSETADYIGALKTQIEVLQALVDSGSNNGHPQ